MATSDEPLVWMSQADETHGEEEKEPSWNDEPLQGMYHQEIEEVDDIEKSYHLQEWNAGTSVPSMGG